MRRDKKSSMAMGMYSVKNLENDAFVTAGATGPFVAGAHLIIRRLDGMKRTALTPLFPKLDGSSMLLMDVGANIEVKPEHLEQYAIAATVYAKEILSLDNPKVGLINNGHEKGKGRDLEKKAYELLENNKKINFIGNVETKNILTTDANILVTDGFTGNAILKATEGAIKAFSTLLKREIKRNLWGKMGYLFMRKNFKNISKAFDVSEIGGAILLGVKHPVIKAHGSSTSLDFAGAIRQASNVVDKKVIQKISDIESEQNGK